jgi:hypothetical protein
VDRPLWPDDPRAAHHAARPAGRAATTGVSARLEAWRRPIRIGLVVAVVTMFLLALTPIGGHGGAVADTQSDGCVAPTPPTTPTTSSTSSTSSTAPPTTVATTSTTDPAAAVAGSQGTDATLPCTPSAVTVTGRGNFSNLTIRVNQTADIVNQAVSISWSGGTPTTGQDGEAFTNYFANDYLQVMECWGSPDDEVPSDPGPPPSQCEFGAEASSNGQVDPGAYPIGSNSQETYTRIISDVGDTCPTDGSQPGCVPFSTLQNESQPLGSCGPDITPACNPADDTYDARSGEIIEPFDAVDGTVEPETVNPYCCLAAPPWTESFDTNPYFNYTTTNEIDFARTFPGGTGQTLFQVDTGLESDGLGCGQTAADNGTQIPDCWLVIVPRGDGAQENPPGGSPGYVQTSPLSPTAWNNRIAIPLTFLPIGTSCSINATPVRILGGEPASRASASWQPTLCGQASGSPYNYEAIGEDQARSDLEEGGGGAGMAVVSDPVPSADADPTDPIVYAPLTLSGVVVGFNIERDPISVNGQPPPSEVAIAGTQVTHINLTPRLVAKLLTESYKDAFFGATPTGSAYQWLQGNPANIFSDPEFLEYNPEFAYLMPNPYVTDASQLVVEQNTSDAAAEVWQWIMADPAAKAWLDGTADPWGMQVNPNYSTSTSVNPAGTAFDDPPIDNFPKSDPYEYVPSSSLTVGTPPAVARNLTFLDWNPYALTMQAAAQAVGAANSGAKTTFNENAPNASSAWSANGPQAEGQTVMFTITTSDRAAQYGLGTASLSQDGDDGSTPTFIPADSTSLLAGEAAMQPSGVTGVVAPNVATTASGAYPMPELTYAAVEPVGLATSLATGDAAFLTYAAGPGQVPGTAFGDLPLGYVPLPSSLEAETATAAATVLNPASLETTTTTVVSTTTAAPTTTSPPSTTVAPTTTTIEATTEGPTTAAPTTTAVPAATTAPVAAVANGEPPVATPTASPTTAAPAPSVLTPPLTATTVALSTTPAVSRGRTPGTAAGFSRFAVLLGLLIGLGAAVAARLLAA